jgi:hypothetical protein
MTGVVAEVKKHSNKSIPRVGTGNSTSRAAARLNIECCGFHVGVTAPPSVINSQAATYSDVPICILVEDVSRPDRLLVYWRIVELRTSLAVYIGGLVSPHSSLLLPQLFARKLRFRNLGCRVWPESVVGLGVGERSKLTILFTFNFTPMRKLTCWWEVATY